MEAAAQRLYISVGSMVAESVTSKITTMGATLQRKRLDSKPENWIQIADMISAPEVVGAIVKLTRRDYESIVRDEYAESARLLLSALSKRRNLLLVHEAIAGPRLDDKAMKPSDAEEQASADEDAGDWNDEVAREVFGEVADHVRDQVNQLIIDCGLSITTYKKNAEASILSVSFIDDASSNLLFRLYVPSGRIFEAELPRMLDLFHDWLGSVANKQIRRAGYKTNNGQVIEFFGDHDSDPAEWSDEVSRFTGFMDVVDDRESAIHILTALGINRTRASDLVSRFARESRRIQLDVRQEYERRVMQIKHELESQLSDESAVPERVLQATVEQLVPSRPSIGLGTGQMPSRAHPPMGPGIVVNQQFIERAEGVVAQNITGSVTVGEQIGEVVELVREIGGPEAEAAQTATRELADASAPPNVRVRAKQELKSFLLRNAQRIEKAAFDLAIRWVENQIT